MHRVNPSACCVANFLRQQRKFQQQVSLVLTSKICLRRIDFFVFLMHPSINSDVGSGVKSLTNF